MMFYKITCLVAGLFHLLLTLFVVSRDIRSKVNRVYLVWGLSLVVWNLSAFFKLEMQDRESLYWVKMIHLGLVFALIGIFHLCLLILDVRNRRYIPALYLIHAGLGATIIFGNLYVSELMPTAFGAFARPGPAFFVYVLLYVVLNSVAIRLLYRRQKQLTGMHRVRLRALLIGYGLLVAFGVHDILQLKLFELRGLVNYPVLGLTIYPLANLAAIFYGIVVAYSVLQHQLLDIHVAMGRVAAQVVRVVFMFVTGLVLLLLALLFDQSDTGIYPYLAALVVILANAVIATLLFPRLFGKGEELWESRLLGDRFEYQDRIRDQILKIRDCHDPTLLLAGLQHLLVETMQVRSYQIILLDETTRAYDLFDSYPMQSKPDVPRLGVDSPVLQYFRTTGSAYLACKTAYALPGEMELERKARQQLDVFNPELCFPFMSGEDPFGLLLVGEKVSQEPYTSHDLRLLSELVSNLRLVLDQIRLKNQIHMAQEQEMLGRMSRGLAHDLNNLLTPIQTCLQLVDAGVTDKETLDELLPMSARNIDTIRAYVNEALFFSRTHQLKLKPVNLHEVMRAAVGLLSKEIQRKQIAVSIDGAGGSDVEIDEVLIQRLISNLLSNAIDATRPGNPIKITVSPLPKTEWNRDWYRIQIRDSGEGISPENLKRVFMPYFSTKNTGDRRRGFGLGLAIARKIVHLHGGNLIITSEAQKGTTVQVDLPSRPPQKPQKVSRELAAEFAT